ncbi:MAG: aminoacyl-tRNA hydrolase [bacterium]
MQLIVGLGNPGSRYRRTRHNIGFQSVDALASAYQIQLSHTDSVSQWGRGTIRGKEVLLVKPQTYMNLSGKAVLTFLSYYHLTYQDLLVIHDDMDLPLGRIRIRGQGRSGGHRGIESIIQCLGTSQFPRLRIGIGRPCGQQEPKEYVLKEFSEEEQTIVAKVIETTVQCVEVILDEGILTAMNRFNRLDAVG